MPPWVEFWAIELPGRGRRLEEKPLSGVAAVVHAFADALEALMVPPYAFFGHSLGALLAYELSNEISRRGLARPTRLFVSSYRAPHLQTGWRPIHSLPQAEFLKHLELFNGTPQEILGHKELIELVMPALRADFALCERYQFSGDPPLSVPISAFGGLDDDMVSGEHLCAWQSVTTRPIDVRLFPGGHFYLDDDGTRRELMAVIATTLSSCVG